MKLGRPRFINTKLHDGNIRPRENVTQFRPRSVIESPTVGISVPEQGIHRVAVTEENDWHWIGQRFNPLGFGRKTYERSTATVGQDGERQTRSTKRHENARNGCPKFELLRVISWIA